MKTTYQIHPGIAIARLGNSPDSFYLGPLGEGELPIECDQNTGQPVIEGTGDKKRPKPISSFRADGKIRREAARFSLYVYDKDNPEGRPLQKGDMIQGIGSKGRLVDVEWTVWLANKKACWYQFLQLQGEHGYSPDHPLRNSDVTDPDARQRLIIDPGPQTVYDSQSGRKKNAKQFARDGNPGYPQMFPAPLEPNDVNTLGEVFTDGDLHLVVLGGHGDSGSYKTGPGHPRITNYANNDGWFDDISDGPVTAKLIYWDELDNQYRFTQVADPAWVLVGYPAYAPELVNLVTIDEVVYDLSVRYFGLNTYLYGTGPFDNDDPPKDLDTWRNTEKRWNNNYYPYFYKEIWPILQRPYNMHWTTTVLQQSLYPHDPNDPRGNFYLQAISQPPDKGVDPNRARRQFIYDALRKPGQENQFEFHEDTQLLIDSDPAVGGNMEHDPYGRLYDAPLMPLLCGDNPLDNILPSKFFRLTDTQLFLLRQWALGKFVNEKEEGIDDASIEREPEGLRMDRAALSNGLGGSFCPGGEVTWIIRNPKIYSRPYRINANLAYLPNLETSLTGTTPGIDLPDRPALSQGDTLETGLEPGDLTKYAALPWQGDFNECATQPIDITYDEFNTIYPANPDDRTTHVTIWWPAHRPLQVSVPVPYDKPTDPLTTTILQYTRGLPADDEGDTKMVTEWQALGFLKNVGTAQSPNFVEVERTNPDIPLYIIRQAEKMQAEKIQAEKKEAAKKSARKKTGG